MGRPCLLGSLPRGPEHREFNELPALGTAPETQKTRSNRETIFRPRRMFRRLAHSLNQEHSRGNRTRQRQTYSIPYRYRTHEAQASQRPNRHGNMPRVVSGGNHVEAVGPSPSINFHLASEPECTTPSHSQSLANFVANVHSQGISAARTNFCHFIRIRSRIAATAVHSGQS